MTVLGKDALRTAVRLMGDDVPEGLEESAMPGHGPGSPWAGTEPCGGPCLHDMCRSVRGGSWPHEGECGPSPSTSGPQVLDCLSDSDRNAVIDACDEGEVTETLIPF